MTYVEIDTGGKRRLTRAVCKQCTAPVTWDNICGDEMDGYQSVNNRCDLADLISEADAAQQLIFVRVNDKGAETLRRIAQTVAEVTASA